MDPDEALRIILAYTHAGHQELLHGKRNTLDYEHAADAADGLADWLQRGGFSPDKKLVARWDHYTSDPLTPSVLRRWAKDVRRGGGRDGRSDFKDPRAAGFGGLGDHGRGTEFTLVNPNDGAWKTKLWEVQVMTGTSRAGMNYFLAWADDEGDALEEVVEHVVDHKPRQGFFQPEGEQSEYAELVHGGYGVWYAEPETLAIFRVKNKALLDAAKAAIMEDNGDFVVIVEKG